MQHAPINLARTGLSDRTNAEIEKVTYATQQLKFHGSPYSATGTTIRSAALPIRHDRLLAN